MNDLPTGTILFLILLDLVLAVGLSVLLGVVVAGVAGQSRVAGVLVGALVPIVGPLIWFAVAASRDSSLTRIQRVRSRGPALRIAAALLLAGAALFLACSPFAWGEVSGAYHQYALASDSSAADTWLGLFATVGTTVVVAAGAALAWTLSAWRRVGIVLILVGAGWTAIGVDSLLVFRALDGIAETVSGASGGNARVSASAGTGLWLALAAGVLTLAGAVRLTLLRREEAVAAVPFTTTAAPSAVSDWDQPPASAPWPAPGSRDGDDLDYGRGF
jgi:hypothetical protein